MKFDFNVAKQYVSAARWVSLEGLELGVFRTINI